MVDQRLIFSVNITAAQLICGSVIVIIVFILQDGKWDSWRHWFVISSPMSMAMLMLLTAKGTDGFSLMVGELPLYQMLLIFGITLLL